MVGQSQKLNMKKAIQHYKAQGIDLSNILYKPDVPSHVQERNTQTQDHQLENVLDFDILRQAHPALYRKEEQHLEYRIKNTNRTVGAILSNEISKIHGADGLPNKTLSLKFTGAAGQSFGGFATNGLYMKVVGTANDYFGKGLSGATLVAQVPEKATFVPHENIIIGNVALYGATNGEAYINGIAGERFCVRNSGIAYLYSEDGTFDEKKFNLEMVELEDLQKEDHDSLQKLLQNHVDYTKSPKATEIVNDWPKSAKKFIKVMPTDYKRALEMMAKKQTEKTV